MSRVSHGSAEAVIVSTARTPLAKSFRGAFIMSHGAHLGGIVVRAAIERAKVEPGEIEDVILGCAYPEGATGGNIARISALIKTVSASRTVLMVEHNLSVVADLSDRITVLTRGRVLAEGDYQTVSAHPSVREAYLGVGHA